MKGQRRHELEQNILADWLGKQVEKIKPYQNLIFFVVLIVAVGLIGYTWWSRHARAQSADAWAEYTAALQSGNPAELQSVADQFPDTAAGECALLGAADIHLRLGCDQLFYSKASANTDLRQAQENYLEVLEKSSDPLLRQQAAFGLGRGLEAEGKLDKAVEQYRQVVENWPGGAFAPAAQQRLDDLKKQSTKVMYDQFAKYDPKPAFGGEPGIPGARPPFDLDSLKEGPLYEPGTTFDLTPSTPGGEGAPLPKPSTGPERPAAGPQMPPAGPGNPSTVTPPVEIPPVPELPAEPAPDNP